MDITITPSRLSGAIDIIPSKSQAHRLLIAAAFADAPTQILCAQTNRDIEATASCLRALGARISRTDEGYYVTPIQVCTLDAVLFCGESGSTLRFLLPIVGALGINATFHLEGRLPERPLSPLWEEMERMGCTLSRPTHDTVRCCGQLHSGAFRIDGGVFSRYITGLLFAAAIMDGSSHIEVTGKTESAPYIALTQQVLALFGVQTDALRIPDTHRLHSPGRVKVEGDWSNGAFFLAANVLGSNLDISGLDPASSQGDRAAFELISSLCRQNARISASDIPDLIPILSVVAAANHGAVFTNIQRLRLKESDRVASVLAMLKALGAEADATSDILTVSPSNFTGGRVECFNDHRIAMSAAIAATVCKTPVTLIGAQCTEKSYPNFWAEYARLEETMSSTYGENLKLSVFGHLHGAAVGMTLDGIPAGFHVDHAALRSFLDRRAPGKNDYSTPRREADEPEFLSGIVDEFTCGAPITAVIRNTNTRSGDYANLKDCPRPGHADYTAQVKYGGFQDAAGGGHFSGRLTAPICIAGGLCKQWLESSGIRIGAHILCIGNVYDTPFCDVSPDLSAVSSDFPVISDESGVQMRATIADARTHGDSVGGMVECAVTGLPTGLGEPMFGGVESRLASVIYGIPAVKGLSFGSGFAVAHARGSENNDPFTVENGHIRTSTNHCGGILGGITNGMPVLFRVALKPTPSISFPQRTVRLSTMEEETLRVQGRHDPCIVPRAVPVIEAAAALAVFDMILGNTQANRKEFIMDLNEYRAQIDRIDTELVKLFTERMDIAAQIASYKKSNDLPILQPGREREKLRAVAELAGSEMANYTRVLYSMLFELSRSYQSKRTTLSSPLQDRIADAIENTPKLFPRSPMVACQGVEGAYSQIACEKIFKEPFILYFKTFDAVFGAIENGLCQYGILPIENSTAGSVKKVYDLMIRHNFSIVRTFRLKVDHNLLANKGATLDGIREIYSHEQAINQCAEFLATLKNVKVIPVENTAVASEMVASSGRTDVAAISSRACCELYSLTNLAASIQDKDNNHTRFICISKQLEIYPGADRTSIMMVLPHRPGSLYRVLARLYTLGINVTKLESRPIPDREFEFMFYFDLETSIYSEEYVRLMCELDELCEEFKYLGSYSEVV